ncbi:tyrosinase-like [Dendrobates tinctorius]|uniref:tyrosinase-like n=1 Tax=Dendrobates tinctorius TaxID=92724 RepID=UPI003CCA0E41
MLLLVVVLLGITSTSAMFYRECVENVASFPVVCCPMYNGSVCGSALNRGSCMPVVNSRTISPPDVHIDDRHLFPIHYYSYTCQCKDNFFGDNCGQCDYNRYGDNCEKLNNVTRKDIRELSETARHQYFAQLHQCKYKIDPDYVILVSGDRFRRIAYIFQNASYYDVWCYIHNYVTRQFINNTRENNLLNFGHGSTGFLTFHRMYMLGLERSMQRCTKDPNFALMYYDWRSEPECTICQDDFLGGNDAHGRLNGVNVFSSWRSICVEYYLTGTNCLMSTCECERPKIIRNPGATPGLTIPTKQDVDYCLSLPVLDGNTYTSTATRSFRNCVEGFRNRFENPDTSMHNRFHLYCGGSMTIVAISCNDPMFIFHHTFIDKIFNIYIVSRNLSPSSYPPNPIYGHQPTDCILPFLPCRQHRRMVVPISNFGVTYSFYKEF